MHPALQALEVRAAIVVERDDLAVEERLAGTHGLSQPAGDLGILRRDVAQVAALEADAAGLAVGQGTHAVPFELEGKARFLAWQLAEAGHHRPNSRGHRLAARVPGRIHPVDHPILALGRKESVAALDPLAVQSNLDLLVLPLLDLVGARVPDRHRPRAVLPSRDLAVEVDVLERMVLGANGEAVVLGGRGNAAGKSPRGEDAVAFQAQVPVQAPSVVLLDHEAILPRLLRALTALRLRRLGERPLRLVLVELALGHRLQGRWATPHA